MRGSKTGDTKIMILCYRASRTGAPVFLEASACACEDLFVKADGNSQVLRARACWMGAMVKTPQRGFNSKGPKHRACRASALGIRLLVLDRYHMFRYRDPLACREYTGSPVVGLLGFM